MRGPEFYPLKLWVSSKVPPQKNTTISVFFWRGCLISLRIFQEHLHRLKIWCHSLSSQLAEGLDGTAKDLQRKGLEKGLGIVRRPPRWWRKDKKWSFSIGFGGRNVGKIRRDGIFTKQLEFFILNRSSAFMLWATRDQTKNELQFEVLNRQHFKASRWSLSLCFLVSLWQVWLVPWVMGWPMQFGELRNWIQVQRLNSWQNSEIWMSRCLLTWKLL